MTAVWMRVRAEGRSRLLAVLILGLLIGLAGGAVLAAATGARRTQTAYPRFVEAQRGLDLVLSVDMGDVSQLDVAARFPQVAESTRVYLIQGPITAPSGRVMDFPDVFPLVDPLNRFGVTMNRLKILAGRAPDPTRVDEAAVSFHVANTLGIRVGSTLRFSFNHEDVNGNPTDKPLGTELLKVVGIEAAPGEFQPFAGPNLPAVHLTPALYRKYAADLPPGAGALVVRLKRGDTDMAAYLAEIRRHGLAVSTSISGHNQTIGVQRSIHFQVIALWLAAGLIALAAVAILGQALARQTFLESNEYPTLRALGMSTGQLVWVVAVRAAAIGAVAGLVGAGTAIALSPLSPTGLARVAEPHPGLFVDGAILAIGLPAMLVVIFAVTLVPAWRAARAAGGALGVAEPAGSERFSRVGASLARAGLPPSTVSGVRMALESGHGRTAVPVRTAVLGSIFGVFALIAALTFGRSLDRLVTVPAISGWNWSVVIGPNGSTTPSTARTISTALDRDPDVSDWAQGTLADIHIGKVDSFVLAMESVKGAVGPSMIEGHAPDAPDEIVLGTDTLRSIHGHVGETIAVTGPGPSPSVPGRTFRLRIVGRMAVPSFFFLFNRPGEGGAVSFSAARRFGASPSADAYFVRFREGVNEGAALNSLRRQTDTFALTRRQPETLSSLRQVSSAPVVLAGVIALMAAATLIHTLVTSIRRRRRDLAILKTLGFVRRQVGATVAWQASTLVAISLAIGVPLGVLSGRLAWSLFADQLGVVSEPVVPVLWVVLLIPVSIVLANAIAWLPGRIAARMSPATVLRSE